MAFMGYFPPVAQKLTPCKAEEMAQQLRYLFLMVSETYFYLFVLRWGSHFIAQTGQKLPI